MQQSVVKMLQSYKVLDMAKWASIVEAANPRTFADYNRAITSGVVIGCIARTN